MSLDAAAKAMTDNCVALTERAWRIWYEDTDRPELGSPAYQGWYANTIGTLFSDAMLETHIPALCRNLPDDWLRVMEMGELRYDLQDAERNYDERWGQTPRGAFMKLRLSFTTTANAGATRRLEDTNTPVQVHAMHWIVKPREEPDYVFVRCGRFGIHGFVPFDELPSLLSEHANLNDLKQMHEGSRIRKDAHGMYAVCVTDRDFNLRVRRKR